MSDYKALSILIVIINQVEITENFWCWTLCQSLKWILNLVDTHFANIMKVFAGWFMNLNYESQYFLMEI